MSTFNRGYKYKIYPNDDQKKLIDKFIDTFRSIYNWGIEKEQEIYNQYLNNNKTGKSFYDYFDLCNIYRVEKNNPELYWLKEIPDHTAILALRNVYNAYISFFNGKNKKPKFSSKKKRKPSFNTRNDSFRIKNNRIRFEGMKRKDYISLRFDSEINLDKVINPVISKDNLGNYYVSFSLEEECKDLNIPKTEGIGIDVGERQTYVISNGKIYNQPKDALKKLERRYKHYQRHVQRDIDRRIEFAKHTRTKYEDIPKSKRAIKREAKCNKISAKISNIKNSFYDQFTNYIMKQNPEFVCMETLSVTDMQKNKVISKQLNTSFYDMIQKMKNKCEQNNIPFIQAHKNFPSSKTCSNCGYIKNMKGKHNYKCPRCGMIMDRDINAAINLKNYGLVNQI